jgi:hypothetical protein
VDTVTAELADTPGGCGGLAFGVTPTTGLEDTPGGCGGLAFDVTPTTGLALDIDVTPAETSGRANAELPVDEPVAGR